MPSFVRPANGGRSVNSFLAGQMKTPKCENSKPAALVRVGGPSSAMTSRIVIPECSKPIGTAGSITMVELGVQTGSPGCLEQPAANETNSATTTKVI
jgi:hypothetical protein